jgi:rubrerythrin
MMHLQAAELAEEKGEYEEAARIYEQLNMTDMARSMRAGNHAGTVMPVNQDLGKLIDQIRNEGLVVLYICPKCNGLIKIDGEYDQGTFCENCGTPLSTAIIASMLDGSFSQLKSL